MRRRGRRFLTRFFMIVTGGIVASLIVGSMYFLLDSTLSIKRLLIIPLLMVAADLTWRLFTSTALPARIGKIAMILGIPALVTTSTSLMQRLPVRQLINYVKKLESSVFSN